MNEAVYMTSAQFSSTVQNEGKTNNAVAHAVIQISGIA